MTAESAQADPAGQPVVTTCQGTVLTLTLNRPERKNAMNMVGWTALNESLRAAAADSHVRAVVITGAGGNFCSGADVTGLTTSQHPLEFMRVITEAVMALHEMPKPVVAQVEGVAVGAGWNLALGCDFVVASHSARFSQIFSRRALSIDFGGSWLLPQIVGLQQAKRLVLLADFVDAAEARELGAVTWVKPADELGPFVGELAGRLASLPPVAVAQSKSLLQEGAYQSMRQALENEARAQAVNFATRDARAAFEAFTEKKSEPVFSGQWAVS
jgi:enoyl-CoA hydratase/carnithine racemase